MCDVAAVFGQTASTCMERVYLAKTLLIVLFVQNLQHGLTRVLGIAKEHVGVVIVEHRVIDSGYAHSTNPCVRM